MNASGDNILRCPFCGGTHSEEVRFCPVTGQALISRRSAPVSLFLLTGIAGILLISLGLWQLVGPPRPAKPSVPSTAVTQASATAIASPTDTRPEPIWTAPPSATPSPTGTPIASPTAGAGLVPRIYGFFVCTGPCLADGSNATRTFPGGITKIHAWWNYENIPIGAHYSRSWTMDGRDWARYDCAWPGPATGVAEISLSEPGGLHSGTWEVTITVDEDVLLREQLVVEGNWMHWAPAGVFNTCYGKK